MSKKVIVACKLPHGIILEVCGKSAALNGRNKELIVNSGYGSTELDAEFWEAWIAANPTFPAVKSGAIFVAKTIVDVAAMAKDFAELETGLEPLRTDGKDKRAKGVKKLDKKDD